MMFRGRNQVLIFLLFVTIAACASAGKFNADLGLGAVIVTDDEYDASYVFDNSIAYSFNHFLVRAGSFYIDELSPKDARGDSELEITAGYLNVGAPINIDEGVILELAGGIVYSKTDVIFLGRKIAEEEDESFMTSATVIIKLNKLFGLQTNWKYIDDLSGGNLHLFEGGVRFSF